MATEDKFSLRWNDFESSLSASFQQFRGSLLDVEILCGSGEVVAAHRLVLCACSEVLREALLRVRPPLSPTSCGPVLVLLDTDKKDLECLLDFMYRGEALVSQERLQSFLNLAEKLQVSGLTQGKNESKSTPVPSSKLHPQSQSSTSKTKLPPSSKPLNAWAARESGKCLKEANDIDQGVGEASWHSGDGVIVENDAMVENVKKEAEEAEDSSINYYSEYWTDGGTQEYYEKPRLKTDSGEEYHPCHLCGKTYKTSGSLKNHRSLYHRKETIKYQSYRGQPAGGSWQGESLKGLSNSRPPQALGADDPQPLQYDP